MADLSPSSEFYRHLAKLSTIVTEATAAGEQSTSGTSLFTECHGNKGVNQKGLNTQVHLTFYPQKTTLVIVWLARPSHLYTGRGRDGMV